MRINLSAAQRIVADLGIAHVIIARQTDGFAVGTQHDPRKVGTQAIQRGRIGGFKSIAGFLINGADANPVHYNEYDFLFEFRRHSRSFLFHNGQLGISFQRMIEPRGFPRAPSRGYPVVEKTEGLWPYSPVWE